MANSDWYNRHYRDLDLIEGLLPVRRTAGCMFRIAAKVQYQERLTLLALGATPQEAYYQSWAAFQGVVDIATKPAPVVYQTTEAKIITGRR